MKDQVSILLVEDNKHDQFFFVHALREIEHASLYAIADNGQDALDKLGDPAALPDLIFTDINMPVMDGIECISRIVSDPQIRHIPLIVLSTDRKKVPVVRELGVKAFIEKPGDCYLLRRQIEMVISILFAPDHTEASNFHTFLS